MRPPRQSTAPVGWVVSFEFALFLAAALLYYFLLHRTNFGRRIFAIGNNPAAVQFSGVRVDPIKFILSCLTGLLSSIAAVLLSVPGMVMSSFIGAFLILVIVLPSVYRVVRQR